MRPEESARIARRIARVVTANPSLPEASANLSDLVSAVDGDHDAAHRLASRLPSKMPEMAELNRAFTAHAVEPPEMRYFGRGRWAGRASGVRVEVHASPDGRVQKVLVASRPVTSWKEAVESVRHHSAMADNGTPEDPEDIANAEEAIGSNAFHCVECGGKVDLDNDDWKCAKCGTDYTSCPGCDKPYPMDKNTDDHCPMCGHSSWGEVPEDLAGPYLEALKAGVAKAAETRQPQVIDFHGFEVHIEVVPEGDDFAIHFAGGDDADYVDLEEWMAEPKMVLNGGLDLFFWQKNNDPMPAPKPWTGGASGGQQQQQV